MAYQAPTQVTAENFGKSDLDELHLFIKEKVDDIDRRLMTFRSEKLPEYVRLYKGRPKQEEVEWPWAGAANLVIQLVGTFSDELQSRVMGGIWMYDPLYSVMLAGDTPDPEGDDKKQIFERFLMDTAYNPDELDLYRVESLASHSAIKYGTGCIYSPYVFKEEVHYTYLGGGEDSSSQIASKKEKIVTKDGPKPELIPLNRFFFEPNCQTLDDMKFFGHIEPIDYWDLQNLKARSPYIKQEAIDKMLNQPDAVQETEMERELNAQFSFSSTGIDNAAARWYLYHCCIRYSKGGENHSLMAVYHKNTRQILYIVYNNYPKNKYPYQDYKLAYDDQGYLGTGFAEMLHIYQKELSNNSNWRTNNRNYAMMGVWRVSPESKLASILEFYPGVAVPAKEGEIELIKPGQDVGYSNEADMFIMSCAKERAGIDPAMGGTGGGIVNQKRGIYSAAGTSMVMAQQNNRNNLRTSDIRSSHVKLGMWHSELYSNFGIGFKLKQYAAAAETLKKALEDYRTGNLGLRIRPSSASSNKELERQNDILLSDRMERFYQAQAQIIEATVNPQCPPELKEYYSQTLIASRVLMQSLLRSFSKDNADILVPKLKQSNQGAGVQNGAGAQIQPAVGSFATSQVPGSPMANGRVPTSPQPSL
jgi:hypothetical protein